MYIVYISEFVLFIYVGCDVILYDGKILSDVVFIMFYLFGLE